MRQLVKIAHILGCNTRNLVNGTVSRLKREKATGGRRIRDLMVVNSGSGLGGFRGIHFERSVWKFLWFKPNTTEVCEQPRGPQALPTPPPAAVEACGKTRLSWTFTARSYAVGWSFIYAAKCFMNRTPVSLAPPCLTFNLLRYNKACLTGHSFNNLRLSVFSPPFSLSLCTFFFILSHRICPASPISPHPDLPTPRREFVFQHPKQPSSLSIRKTEVMKRGLFSSDALLVLGPSLLASHLLTLGVG